MTTKTKQHDELNLISFLRDFGLYANAKNIYLARASLTFSHGKKHYRISVKRLA